MTDGLVIPGQGQTAPSGAGDRSLAGVVKGFRPGAPVRVEPQGDGLIVALSAVPGFTKPTVLKTPFYFQCSPLDTMPQDYTWEWNDFQTVSSGYHSNPSSPGLATWSFDTLFVDNDTQMWFTLVRNQHVLSMLDTLKAIGDSMSPLQMQFGQPNLWGRWDVVSGVTLRGLHVEERHGEPDARYLTVSFTEFPDTPDLQPVPPPPHATSKHSGQGATNPTPPRGTLAVLDSSKLLVGRRTLAALAKHYYGSAAAWRLIAKASGLTSTGPNVDLTTTVGRRHPPSKVVVPRRTNATPSPQAKKRAGR